MSFEWMDALSDELFQIQWPESVKQWREQIVRHGAVSEELTDYRPKLNNYLQATY